MGDARGAIPYMERGVALYDKTKHASQAALYAGHDPGACCRYQLGLARWLLGYPDRAVEHARDARQLADELRHPQTLTVTLWFTTILHHLRGDRQAAGDCARDLQTLVDLYGFIPWSDVAIVVQPIVAEGRPDAAALRELHRRLMGVPTATWRQILVLCALVELALDAGHPAEARRALESIPNRTALLAAETIRLEGELLLHEDAAAHARAEERFRAAIQLARERAEKSLELRATTSLARLLAARGKRDEARTHLTTIYTWFTEGHDTRDLREAKTLLMELDAR
jgi:hypothetical protein